jgi:hypothetical protein
MSSGHAMYRRRTLDDELDVLFGDLPAIARLSPAA